MLLRGAPKPIEAAQRDVKIKIWVNFYFNRTFWNARGGNVYILEKKLTGWRIVK